jgi:hypothetical protein
MAEQGLRVDACLAVEIGAEGADLVEGRSGWGIEVVVDARAFSCRLKGSGDV